MTTATDTPPPYPEQVSLSGFGEITERPSNLTAYLHKFGQLREKPSFKEVEGTNLTKIILWAIIVMTAAFLAAWWFTRPSIEEVNQLLGAVAEGKGKLEALQALRAEHFNTFRDLFQLVVSSVLLPVFTLLAGYVFGSREAGRPE